MTWYGACEKKLFTDLSPSRGFLNDVCFNVKRRFKNFALKDEESIKKQRVF